MVFPCCPSFDGARGFAFNSNRSQFFAAKGTDVAIYDENLDFEQEQTLTQTGGSIATVGGLTFSGNILYLAHKDGSTGQVSRSFLATTVTT
ncbi:MAG: hypothetical protein IH870_03950, partial [Chloroflexi bacterium]|nr:hypothetical protein [Chloroflexota bacterium]